MSLLYSPLRQSAAPGGSVLRDDQSIGSASHARVQLSLLNMPTPSQQHTHLYVLPVLLLEFLAVAVTRAVLPSILLHKFGSSRIYLVMGFCECVRGLLAFVSCPLFGKLSDTLGRRTCLFVTVLGTCAPVCSLAFFAWDNNDAASPFSVDRTNETDNLLNTTLSEPTDSGGQGFFAAFFPTPDEDSFNDARQPEVHPYAITIFVILLSLSGIFSSTFTLVFAYISDTVKGQEERISAYGLALATFGLSFTIGPMAGGYLAQWNTQYVFITSLILTVVDLLYIYVILPESKQDIGDQQSTISLRTLDVNMVSWNPKDTLRILAVDPFLRQVGQVTFLYYTGLWAILSTLSVYAVERFHLTPERLGELMSALGLSTMVAEAVLVRMVVSVIGEKRSVQVGLVSFAIQCTILGFANHGWQLFVCALFSLAANLVYPSISSLVSGTVDMDSIGEALGAVNGIKALTEGIGPLVFGSLMTISEHSVLPGWPYLIAAVFAVAAYKAAEDLPDHEDYIHELDRNRYKRGQQQSGIVMRAFRSIKDDDDDEYGILLSEVDSSDTEDGEEEEEGTSGSMGDVVEGEEDISRLPRTFASFLPKTPTR